MKLIETYTAQMADDVAADRLAKIKQAGVEKVTFAWAGETEIGKKHYYRIQGPTFLVEYDNTQNDGNHVHSVWRDFTRRFRPRPAARARHGRAALAGFSGDTQPGQSPGTLNLECPHLPASTRICF